MDWHESRCQPWGARVAFATVLSGGSAPRGLVVLKPFLKRFPSGIAQAAAEALPVLQVEAVAHHREWIEAAGVAVLKIGLVVARRGNVLLHHGKQPGRLAHAKIVDQFVNEEFHLCGSKS